MTIVSATSASSALRASHRTSTIAASPVLSGDQLARLTDTAFVGAPRKGKKASVEERFSTLEQRFLPEKAKGVNVKLQFQFSGSGGGDWFVEIKDGKIKVTKGKGGKADATVKAAAKDYEKMANGEMNKTIAFLRGKLKIEGDRKYLDDWETWFKPL